MTNRAAVAELLAEHGTTFAEEAGISLADGPEPLWQLFVLSQLMSARIRASVAVRSARELFAIGCGSPAGLRATSWRQRVDALGRGGYRRYDFSTATRLEHNAAQAAAQYGDDLRRLREPDARRSDAPEPGAQRSGDVAGATTVSARLQEFEGIGPAGAGIFLREVQGTWPELAPWLDAATSRAAVAHGLPGDPAELAALVAPEDFPRLCAALLRAPRTRPARGGTA